jgi:hypothetical protein
MAERDQTYKTHARWLPLFHFFVIPVLLGNVILAIWRLVQLPALGTAWGVIVAIALLGVGFLSRTQALTVQDRLIRLEERLRMQRLLPQELHPQITGLTRGQMVALRFASDEELADLVREVVGGRLTTPKDIKMRERSWRPDWLRA